MENTNISTLQRLIESLRQTAEELKRAGGMIPAVERNVSRLLASVKMLEINCCDLENETLDNSETLEKKETLTMLAKARSRDSIEPMDGVSLKSMAHGSSTHLVEFSIQPGTMLAEHSHPQEQTGYLVSGAMTLTINGIPHQVEPGDSWCIPENVAHCAEIHQESKIIEVFSPPRQEFK